MKQNKGTLTSFPAVLVGPNCISGILPNMIAKERNPPTWSKGSFKIYLNQMRLEADFPL